MQCHTTSHESSHAIRLRRINSLRNEDAGDTCWGLQATAAPEAAALSGVCIPNDPAYLFHVFRLGY